LKKRDSEVASLDKRLSGLESKLNEAHIQHKKMADDLSKAGKVKKDLEEQCTKLHRDLQSAREETKAVCCEKVELENKIRNVQQEGERAVKVVEEKYSVILAKKEVEIGEFRERNDSENKAKLDEALDALRAECDQRLQDVMSEQENLRKIREKDVAAQVNRFNEAMTARNGEFATLNVKLTAEAKKVSVLEGERLTFQKDLAAAKKRIDELEHRMGNEKDKWEKNLQQLESEKEGLLNEFNDLLNVKIALDNEISMYRQLLENEEQRLNITPTPTKRKIEEVVPPEEQTAPKKKVVEVVPPQEEQETPKSDRPKRHRPSKH
jgi:chromosome segregation ATPase